jgi:Xaa-Pro aminopeptidase
MNSGGTMKAMDAENARAERGVPTDCRVADFRIKEGRLLEAIASSGFSGAVLARQDNFAWLTSGGESRVSSEGECGAAILLIGPGRRQLFAKSMDGRRILEEELRGLDFDLVELAWYEESCAERLLSASAGEKLVSDFTVPAGIARAVGSADAAGSAGSGGVECRPGFFTALHYPLTAFERERYRELARMAEAIIREAADLARPGMKESELAAFLRRRYAEEGMEAPVVIVGSDERIALYRHCMPTEKRLRESLLLAPAPRKWGLCAPISRMVFFGDSIPDALARSYGALLRIEAATLASCETGARLPDIFETQKRLFASEGFPDEWKRHFQGGLTGYIINDPTGCLDPEARVREGQAFNWYVTITGAKVEETCLVTATGAEVLSSRGAWPTISVDAGGKTYALPGILGI